MTNEDGFVSVDAEELRRLSSAMKGASVLVARAGRDLVSRPLPAMPPSVAAVVGDAIRSANAELQHLALEWVDEADALRGRALWVESGADDPSAWLLPESAHDLSSTDEALAASERWALERISDPIRSPEESVPADVIAEVQRTSQEPSSLRGFTSDAAAAFESYRVTEAATGAGDGVLGLATAEPGSAADGVIAFLSAGSSQAEDAE